MSKNTLFDKVFEQHVISSSDEDYLLYIDLHLIHEVTSPQAFDGLRKSKKSIRRPNLTFATMDHNVPTKERDKPIKDLISDKQMKTLKKNCNDFNVTLFDLKSEDQGIVHVIGPELGLTLPGKTIVCGDSHTATHGAFGCLAFGIGTSEVEHVLATQCLWQKKPKVMQVNFVGNLQNGVSSKDMILKLIGKIGTAGATGYVLEYTGNVISELSVEARMTICNMSIEAGARAGMIAPDEKVFKYIRSRKYSLSKEEEEKCLSYWKNLYSDDNSEYDAEITIDCSNLLPQVTWGTSPGMVSSIDETIPYPDSFDDINSKKGCEQALKYMGIEAGTLIKELPIDKVFIGSCTNSRIEDIREAAYYVRGEKKSDKIKLVLVVPGSKKVKEQAEKEGLDIIFKNAGFEWREPGCSMCLAMNDDVLEEGDFCASTSNRNFEGRQGKGGKTFLVSPAMAALAAVHGNFVDVREIKKVL